jgi:hypothetical protein
MPGLHDMHVHPTSAGMQLIRPCAATHEAIIREVAPPKCPEPMAEVEAEFLSE